MVCARLVIRGNKQFPTILPVDKSYLEIRDPCGFSVIVLISEAFKTSENDKIGSLHSCLIESPEVLAIGLLVECLQMMYIVAKILQEGPAILMVNAPGVRQDDDTRK